MAIAREIEIVGLRKSFGPNEVLHGLDLRIPGGQFVGLMGPNGAGKSTLIKILDGVHAKSGGEIHYGGQPVPSLAARPEVGFIHQDLGLIDELSIADNLRLGEPPMRTVGPLLAKGRERQAAGEALSRVELDLPVDTLVGSLSPGEKTLVAIARVLQRGANVLFVDEATSTLPPADSRRLIETLKDTAAQGSTVIMVSHKLSEILDATSRIVLLLDGNLAADAVADQVDRPTLVRMLVNHERESVGAVSRSASRPTGDGKAVLSFEGVAGGRLERADFSLSPGEVLGFTGLPGSGLHDLAYLAHGSLEPAAGRVIRSAGSRSALVPPHRESQGGFADQSVLTNLTLSALPRWCSPGRLIRGAAERREATALIDRLDIRPADPDAQFGTLSGGNKQKVIFGRTLLTRPDFFVLCEPTRGVDVGTRMKIYELIDELSREGAAVVVASSDSEDLFAVCDRIAVIVDGELGEFIDADATNPERLEAFI